MTLYSSCDISPSIFGQRTITAVVLTGYEERQITHASNRTRYPDDSDAALERRGPEVACSTAARNFRRTHAESLAATSRQQFPPHSDGRTSRLRPSRASCRSLFPMHGAALADSPQANFIEIWEIILHILVEKQSDYSFSLILRSHLGLDNSVGVRYIGVRP